MITERILKSIKNKDLKENIFGGLAFGLFWGLVGVLAYGLACGLAFGLAYGLAFGLFWGLVGGLACNKRVKERKEIDELKQKIKGVK
jgi:hypothetical protein